MCYNTAGGLALYLVCKRDFRLYIRETYTLNIIWKQKASIFRVFLLLFCCCCCWAIFLFFSSVYLSIFCCLRDVLPFAVAMASDGERCGQRKGCVCGAAVLHRIGSTPSRKLLYKTSRVQTHPSFFIFLCFVFWASFPKNRDDSHIIQEEFRVANATHTFKCTAF